MKVYDICYEEYKWAKSLQIADIAGSEDTIRWKCMMVKNTSESGHYR